MNLKEEIAEIFYHFHHIELLGDWVNFEHLEDDSKRIYLEQAWMVLDKVEKRIDELIQQDVISSDNDPDWKSGFDEALDRVKEILK